MQIRDWQEFYDSLVIESLYRTSIPLPKPEVAQLNQFEAETGFRLPESYREYILVFGAGELLTDWKISAPCCAMNERRRHTGTWDLQKLQEDIPLEEWWVRSYPEEQRELICRCRYFCKQYKDVYAWDPTDICNASAHEYAVYRMTEDHRVVRVAESFRGFVEHAVRSMEAVPDWDEGELGPWLRFKPGSWCYT